MKSQLQSNCKRSIAMHKLSPSSTLRWTKKSSTKWMAWKKLKMCETTLRMIHEGSKPVKKAKIDMLEGNSIDLSCLIMKSLKICSIA
jgi:hypothetical protein